MKLEQIEYYRQVKLNGKDLESVLLKGDISIDTEQGAVSTCTFSMYNESDTIPMPMNPISASRSMIGQSIEIYAGYLRGLDSVQRIFNGFIKRADLNFDATGRASTTFEAYSYGYSLASMKRTEVYPVFFREADPLESDEGIVVRALSPGDNRNWAVVSQGESLTLEDIIRGIVEMYDVKIGAIVVPKIDYDGLERELHQVKESDWAFLNRLALDFACHMTIDEKDGKFYFVERDKLKDEKELTLDGREVKNQLSFYFHRQVLDEETTWPLAPKERMDPVRRDAALPMLDVSYSFDATSVMGGMVRQSYDNEGNLKFSAAVVSDDNKISYETLEIRKDKLRSSEAEDFISNYEVGKTTWEDTKEFWKTVNVEIQHDPGSRDNPPVIKNANLEFTTYGNVHVVPMRRYKIYNMGFGRSKNEGDEDVARLLCVGITHNLSETYKMTIRMWAF